MYFLALSALSMQPIIIIIIIIIIFFFFYVVQQQLDIYGGVLYPVCERLPAFLLMWSGGSVG
jgi:uncharacterized membrane protein (DUF106 family)